MLYNILEKLRADEALTEREKVVHERGLVSVLRSRWTAPPKSRHETDRQNSGHCHNAALLTICSGQQRA